MTRAILFLLVLIFAGSLKAGEHDIFVVMQEYLDFAPYSDGTISTEQLSDIDVSKLTFIDTRNAGQFAKGHIHGAVNIDWREVLQRKEEIPRDKPVIMYCETGLLSSKAQFMLQLAGYDNVKVLWGGYLAWSTRQTFQEAAAHRNPE